MDLCLRTLDMLYFGSIGLMVLGGLITMFGLIGRIEASIAAKTKPSPPKRRKLPPKGTRVFTEGPFNRFLTREKDLEL